MGKLKRKFVVFGAGGHGRTLAGILHRLGYEVRGFVDDTYSIGRKFGQLEVIGSSDDLAKLRKSGVELMANGVGGITDPQDRIEVSERIIRAGFELPPIIDPSSVIEESAEVAEGSQILPMSYVGVDCFIGRHVIANAGVVVSHDCVVGSFCNLAPGVQLAGGVTVGERTLLGVGVVVTRKVNIGNNAKIGSGAIVKADVPPDSRLKAGAVWSGA